MDNPIICHDDSIVFRGQKHEVGLSKDWRTMFDKDKNITHYWLHDLNKRYSLEEREEALLAGASPVSARKRKIGKDSYIVAQDSYIDFRFNDLYEDFTSRYRKCLDEIVKASSKGIITYKGEAERGSRDHQEAMRNRLKRHWKVSKYEHNLLIFDEVLGRELLFRLHPYNQDKTRLPGETVYLKGYDYNDTLLVKVYDMSKKEGYNKSVVKIEVTLRKSWMKDNGMRKVSDYTMQPDIQKKIEATLKREWKNAFKKAGLVKEFSKIMGTTQLDLFDEIAEQRNTLEKVLIRMDSIEREHKDIKTNIDRINKHLGMNTQEMDKD